MKRDWGVIIVRHVVSELTDRYWQISWKRIQHYYPETPVLIVDDHSDPSMVSPLQEEKNMLGIIQVPLCWKGRGEILGYHYFLRLRPFSRALILHDSVFLNGINLPSPSSLPVHFLWTFPSWYDVDTENIALLSCLHHADQLVAFYLDKTKWQGCFGVMSMMSLDFLEALHQEYGFPDRLLPSIHGRGDRSNMERVFACVCSYHQQQTKIPALLGNIYEYGPVEVTLKAWEEGRLDSLPLQKIWTGR